MVIRGESFYDWCQRTDNQSFLLRWDNKKNIKTPNDIFKTDSNDYYFICENGLHDSFTQKPLSISSNKSNCKCPICNSFGKWCEDHNRLDLLKRWDYERNDCSPYELSISSTKKQYFKCPRNLHVSELKDLNNIRKQYGSGRCIECESIGQYGIDNVDSDFLTKYWSDKNTIDPMITNKNSMKKIWIKCQNIEYHDDYEISCSNFVAGKRCPYCAGKKVSPGDSLGVLYPQAFDKWVEKKTTPLDYLPSSNKKVYWNCEKHGQYRRAIYSEVCADFICPECSKERTESRLQEKVRTYIEYLYEDVRHEYDCTIIAINPDTNYKLPYDNEIVSLKLIIEVNGSQHYKNNAYKTVWRVNGKTPDEALKYRQTLDKIKKQHALSNGYNYLVIPFWTDDKKETWKKLIDQKIASIALDM